MIRFEDVTKAYKGDVVALRELSLEILKDSEIRLGVDVAVIVAVDLRDKTADVIWFSRTRRERVLFFCVSAMSASA